MPKNAQKMPENAPKMPKNGIFLPQKSLKIPKEAQKRGTRRPKRHNAAPKNDPKSPNLPVLGGPNNDRFPALWHTQPGLAYISLAPALGIWHFFGLFSPLEKKTIWRPPGGYSNIRGRYKSAEVSPRLALWKITGFLPPFFALFGLFCPFRLFFAFSDPFQF